MTPPEIAAYIGAAAWAPQLAKWAYAATKRTKLLLVSMNTPEIGKCTEKKRLKFGIHNENSIYLVNTDSDWPCEHEEDWLAQWREGKRHYVYLCEKHAVEIGLQW